MDGTSLDLDTAEGFFIVADADESRTGAKDAQIQQLREEVQHWKEKYADLEKEHSEALARCSELKTDCETGSQEPDGPEAGQAALATGEPNSRP